MLVPSAVIDGPLDPDSFESEINNGLEGARKHLSICFTGENTEAFEAIQPRYGHLNAIARNAYRYAALGGAEGHFFRNDELHDLIAFTSSAGVNDELFSTGRPVNLERLLHTLMARAKVDRYQSLPTYEVERYEPIFNYIGQPELTLAEIILLSGMSEMAVRNASRSTGKDHLEVIKQDGRVLIEISVAIEWLKERQSFVPRRSSEGLDEGKQVLVPFAKDGSFFCGRCLRKRGYQVGKKGDEQYIIDLYDALERLKKMEKARWRRPNKKGIPGIVAVVEWKPVSKADFEAVKPDVKASSLGG